MTTIIKYNLIEQDGKSLDDVITITHQSLKIEKIVITSWYVPANNKSLRVAHTALIFVSSKPL